VKKTRSACLLILIGFLCTLSVGVYAQEEERPDFSLLEYQTGERHTFEDMLTARLNIMVVTSTTCGSCIRELKAMDRIRENYAGDMSVTAIFVDRGGESRVSRYLRYYRFDLDRILVDPGGAVPSRFNAPIVPTMIMFDRQGRELSRKTGFVDEDEALIMSRAEELMYGRKQGEGKAPEGQEAPGMKKTTGCATAT
jgi:thioredoxin-related protein